MFDVFAVSYGKTLNVAMEDVALIDTPILFSQANVNRATRARISNTGQAVRVAIGASTGVSDGIYYPVNSVIVVSGSNNIRTLTIRALVDGAVVNIELED